MRRYGTAILGFVALFSALPWSAAAAETAAPEILDADAAKAVWQRIVESRDNLDIADKTKLVTDVPLVASDDAASAPAAVLAAMVCYLDGEHGNVSGILSGSLAMTIRTIILEQETDSGRKAALVKRVRPIWSAVCQEYNQDILKAAQAFGKKASKGECYMAALQTYYGKAEGSTPLDRMSKAATSFLMARDIHASAAVEEASWARCCEALNRDMPFACLLQSAGGAHVCLAIGYLEGGGKRHLVVLDPVKFNDKNKARTRLAPNRGHPDGEPPVVDAVGGDRDIYTRDVTLQPEPTPPRGVVVISVSADRLPCLFVHNMRRDGQAVQARVHRLLLQRNDDNGTRQ